MSLPDRATFTVKAGDADYFEIGSVGMQCQVDWDHEQRSWRAWDEHGNEAWADYKPLAAARLFVERLEEAERA